MPKSLRHRDEIMRFLEVFVQSRPDVAKQIELEFQNLADSLEACEWFMTHEVVGSSVLVIYDGAVPPRAPPVVAMIDFANTFLVEQYGLTRLTHREPWVKGNHEEGYLKGLDSLVDCFSGLAAALGVSGGKGAS